MANNGSRINKKFWDNIVVPDLDNIRAKAAANQPTRMDLANRIMSEWGMHNVQYPKASQKKGGHGPSAISRVMDILSRGLYATAGNLKENIEDAKEGKFNPGMAGAALNSGFWKGVTGKEKTTTRDVLKEAGVKNKLALGAGGLAGDIFLDPLTYVPGANIVGAVNKFRKGAGAFKVFEEIAPKTVATGRAAKKVSKAIGEGFSTSEAKFGTKGPFAKGAAKQIESRGLGVQKIADNAPEARAFQVSQAGVTSEIAMDLLQTPTATPASAIAEAAARPKPKPVNIEPPAATQVEEVASSAVAVDKSHVPDISSMPPAINALVREANERIAAAGRQSPETIAKNVEAGDTASMAAVENAMTPNTVASRAPIKPQDKAVVDEMVGKWSKAVDRADRIKGKITEKGQGNPHFNPAKQKQVINELWTKTGYLAKYPERRKKRMLTLLRHVNAEMSAKVGSKSPHPMVPSDYYGNPFDIADVIDQIDIKKYKSLGDIATHIDNYFAPANSAAKRSVPPDISDAVSSILQPGIAGRGMQVASSAAKYSEPAIREITRITEEGGVSAPRVGQFSEKASDAAYKAVKDETGDETAARVARDAVYTKPKITEDIGDSYKAQGETPSKVRDEEIWQRDSVKTERSISATLGDWFVPSRGMEAVHALLLQGRGKREVDARLNAKFLRSMARTYTKTELKEAYDMFRRGLTTEDPKLNDIKSSFTTIFENMYGATGLGDEILKNHTVLGRSGALMEELNSNLARKGSKARFQTSVELPDGNMLDLMEANPRYGWLLSMNFHDAADPLEHLNQLRSAIDLTLTERTVMMDFAKKFASQTPQPGHVRMNDNVHLADVWVPKELAPQVRKMLDTLHTFNDPKNELLKTYDYGMRIWKTLVTVLNPKHHVNNMLGDLYLNWIAGVSNPKYYTRSAKLMKSQKGIYKDITNMNRMIGENATGLASDAKFAKQTAATLKTGDKLNGDEVMALARQTGILPSATMTEDINTSIPSFLQGIAREYSPSKRSFMGGIRGVSEMRDHYPRLAQFMHELEHIKGTSKADIISKAAERVRKYHPDGTNLTRFEQNVMRRTIPFYSWMRKAIPVSVEAAVHNPARTLTAPAKLMLAIQTMTGVEGTDLGDPFPEDQLFPSWIQHTGVGPIFKPGTKLPIVGETSGYGLINPKFPVFDFMDQYIRVNPVKPIVGSITPAAKIAIEIGMDQDSFTGAKISNNKKKYALNQVPIVGSIGKITDQGVETDPTKYIGGNLAPIDTGDYIASAEHEQQFEQKKQARKTREQALKDFYK